MMKRMGLKLATMLAGGLMLAACTSGTAGLKNSRQTGSFVDNHPMGCLVLAPFCPMIQAYTLLPENAPPQPTDPVWATAKDMAKCADQHAGRKHASELAACQNEMFNTWASKGGMSAAVVSDITALNSANAAQVQAGGMAALQAQLEWNALMERATLESAPSAYTPNAEIVPSALLAWQQHECAAHYGSVDRQEYVYQAICENAGLMAWARRSNVTLAQIQPILEGNLSIGYQEQSQKLTRAQAQAQREALMKSSGLDFSVPQTKNVFPSNTPASAAQPATP